jgi:hypothetical protein
LPTVISDRSEYKSFKKIEKKSDVNNVVIYQHTKFELKIPYIWGCIIMINSEILKICIVHYYRCQILLFLHSSEYKLVRHENLQVCGTQHCIRVDLISDYF